MPGCRTRMSFLYSSIVIVFVFCLGTVLDGTGRIMARQCNILDAHLPAQANSLRCACIMPRVFLSTTTLRHTEQTSG